MPSARPASDFGLYWADIPGKCCFCPQAINKDDAIWSGHVNGSSRRAHTSCAHQALVKLVEMRDAKGKSEDR